jgi:hypothetical protein
VSLEADDSASESEGLAEESGSSGKGEEGKEKRGRGAGAEEEEEGTEEEAAAVVCVLSSFFSSFLSGLLLSSLNFLSTSLCCSNRMRTCVREECRNSMWCCNNIEW